MDTISKSQIDESGKITVFLVEDFELLRDGLKLALERTGKFVVIGEAADGSSAFSRIAEARPNVSIIDIGLPIVDGIQLTTKLRQEQPEIKVIMLTSHDHEEEIYGAFAAGAQGYCLKDNADRTLVTAIQAVHQGSAWFDPRISTKLLSDMCEKRQRVQNPKQEDLQLILSAREIEVLQLLTEGLSNKEIAARLNIQAATARTHVEHIIEKLQVSGRTQAAVKALRMGIAGES
jgi:DNA-binding NarL/FixJ family response regulator